MASRTWHRRNGDLAPTPLLAYRIVLMLCLQVAPWTLERRPRPPHAGRTKEWGDSQRTPGHVRYMDELDAQRGGANKSGQKAPR